MKKSFSLCVYLGIVILLSWPFQIAYFFLGETHKPLLLVSMVMVGVATYICGNHIFKDGFKNAGWNWGKPKHYFYVFGFALFLWLFPSVFERLIRWYTPFSDMETASAVSLFSYSFLLTIIPAFGEEFSWRGYLLPRLLKKHSHRKALLLHGLVTWIWHLPVLIIMGLKVGGTPFVSVAVVLVVSFLPTIMHAVVFAYIWNRAASLAVVTIYHVSFDEIRDVLESSVGLGALGQNWQMLVLTILGIWFLWKARWQNIDDTSTISDHKLEIPK